MDDPVAVDLERRPGGRRLLLPIAPAVRGLRRMRGERPALGGLLALPDAERGDGLRAGEPRGEVGLEIELDASAASASKRSFATTTPLPAARPSAFTTMGAPTCAI